MRTGTSRSIGKPCARARSSCRRAQYRNWHTSARAPERRCRIASQPSISANFAPSGVCRTCACARQTLKIGEHIDNVQFEAGWFAGARGHSSASRLGLAIDSTYVSGNAFEETSKIEVVAGRIERRGKMGRRFACVVMRRPFTRMLVAGALKQSGWHRRTRVDVVNDGAKGVRSLITDVAPRVAAPCSIGFISRPRRCSRRY